MHACMRVSLPVCGCVSLTHRVSLCVSMIEGAACPAHSTGVGMYLYKWLSDFLAGTEG